MSRYQIGGLIGGALCFMLSTEPWTDTRAEVLLERAVVVTGEWPPFTTERIEGHGLLSVLVTEILKAMGRDPEYQFLPFSIALETTNEGNAIGSFPWLRNAEREKEFVYSNALLDIEFAVFVNPTVGVAAADLVSFDDLKTLKTVRVAGYAYGKLDCLLDYGESTCPVKGNGGAVETTTIDSEFHAFEMLNRGEVDYLAASEAVGRSLIERAFSVEDQKRFTVIDRPEFRWSMSVHFLFPNDRADAATLKSSFDAVLAEFETNGRIAELRQRLKRDVLWAHNIVDLNGGAGTGLAAGYRKSGSQAPVILPRGTRGVVLEWSASLRGRSGETANDATMTRVLLTNGPLRGERLWVPDVYLELVGD